MPRRPSTAIKEASLSGQDRVYWHVTIHPYRWAPAIWDELEQYLPELVQHVAARMGFNVLRVATMPDHVHLLLEKPPWLDLIEIIRQVKGYSGRMILLRYPDLRLDMRSPGFWARGYHYTRHTEESLPTVLRYLDNQKARGGLE